MGWISRRLGGTGRLMVLGLCFLLGTPGAACAEEAGNGVTVVIDPGHQEQGDDGLEPVAPGSKERKPKVTSGTAGVSTGIAEYELNLAVSLLLREKLAERGYRVVMTRETHDVRLSNIDRAEIGNRERAALSVRIHADGSESPAAEGISLLHPAEPSVPEPVYRSSRRAAELMLNTLVGKTGASGRGVIPRSDLTGFNWSQVPVVLVEMGFMSNPQEDRRMATDGYRELLAEGMAEGIDAYFAEQEDMLEPELWDGSLLLLRETPLYHREGSIFAPSGAALSPQRIESDARSGGWYRVDTWLGPRWIPGGGYVLENGSVPTVSRWSLQEITALYDTPAGGGGSVIGRLSPQTVAVLYEWNGWRCIDTWLGPVWIRDEG